MKVYSPVVTRREMKKGEHLLYGGQRLTKDTEVAIVRYGYADGLSREKTGELLANRCMDLSAYPLKDGDEEETIFNMVNAMLFRIHQSGNIADISENRMALIGEAIATYKQIRQDIKRGVPLFLTDFAYYDAP